jgi:hypothetical protein
MKKVKYSPEESLKRIKLMMGYDMSKTLNENRNVIFEQDEINDDTGIAQSFYKSATVWNGTDEKGMVSAIELIKDKGQFDRVNGVVKEIWKKNFKKDDFGIEKIINSELGVSDLDFIKQITEHLKKIGIPATYEVIMDQQSKQEKFKEDSFKLNHQTSMNSNDGSVNQPITTPNTYEEVQSGKGNLKIGMKGPAVNQLQQMLVALGYNLGTTGTNKNGVDGDFGKLTRDAVKDFQSKNGLMVNGVADGIVGRNTAPKIVEKFNEIKASTASPQNTEQPNTENGGQVQIPTQRRLSPEFGKI